MLLVLPEFDFVSAASVAEACSLLSRYGRDCKLLAGGTDLLIKMKHKRMLPRRLLNIKKIPNLDKIHYDERDGLRIGALTTIQSLTESPVIAGKCPVLGEAAALLGTTQVRNIGTIGGNLANASPSADCAPVLLIFGASVRCAGVGGERVVPLEEFFVAPGESALQHGELLTEVHVPNLLLPAEGIYLKHSLRRMDVSMAAAAVIVSLDGDVCREVRIALGAVAPTPFRAKKAEEILRGKKLTGEPMDGELLEEAGRIASEESFPIDDIRGYAAYRRKVVANLVTRGLEQVIARFRHGPEQRPA